MAADDDITSQGTAGSLQGSLQVALNRSACPKTFRYECVQKLSGSAPLWALVPGFDCRDYVPTTEVVEAPRLVEMYTGKVLSRSTMLVGLLNSTRPHLASISHVPAAFLRPLEYLLELVESGSFYRPVTPEDLQAGLPPPHWCLPLHMQLQQHAGTSALQMQMQFQEYPNMQALAMAALGGAPYWCLVHKYHEGAAKCDFNWTARDLAAGLISKSVSPFTLVLGLKTPKDRNLPWMRPSLFVPLAAILHQHQSGVAYLPVSRTDLNLFNSLGFKAAMAAVLEHGRVPLITDEVAVELSTPGANTTAIVAAAAAAAAAPTAAGGSSGAVGGSGSCGALGGGGIRRTMSGVPGGSTDTASGAVAGGSPAARSAGAAGTGGLSGGDMFAADPVTVGAGSAGGQHRLQPGLANIGGGPSSGSQASMGPGSSVTPAMQQLRPAGGSGEIGAPQPPGQPSHVGGGGGGFGSTIAGLVAHAHQAAYSVPSTLASSTTNLRSFVGHALSSSQLPSPLPSGSSAHAPSMQHVPLPGPTSLQGLAGFNWTPSGPLPPASWSTPLFKLFVHGHGTQQQWWILDGHSAFGPLSAEQMLLGYVLGYVSDNTLVCPAGPLRGQAGGSSSALAATVPPASRFQPLAALFAQAVSDSGSSSMYAQSLVASMTDATADLQQQYSMPVLVQAGMQQHVQLPDGTVLLLQPSGQGPASGFSPDVGTLALPSSQLVTLQQQQQHQVFAVQPQQQLVMLHQQHQGLTMQPHQGLSLQQQQQQQGLTLQQHHQHQQGLALQQNQQQRQQQGLTLQHQHQQGLVLQQHQHQQSLALQQSQQQQSLTLQHQHQQGLVLQQNQQRQGMTDLQAATQAITLQLQQVWLNPEQ